IQSVLTEKGACTADVIVSGADYHFTETELLPAASRSYDDAYWEKKVMAPSCLLYYIGLNKKLNNAVHHSLVFDVPFEQHGREIYKNPGWPSNPLFYVSIPSVTDSQAAPAGCENMVWLVPVASGLAGDTEQLREAYFQQLLHRFEAHTRES